MSSMCHLSSDTQAPQGQLSHRGWWRDHCTWASLLTMCDMVRVFLSMVSHVKGGQTKHVDLIVPGQPACFLLLPAHSDSHAEGQEEDRQSELGGSCPRGVSGL